MVGEHFVQSVNVDVFASSQSGGGDNEWQDCTFFTLLSESIPRAFLVFQAIVMLQLFDCEAARNRRHRESFSKRRPGGFFSSHILMKEKNLPS